MKLIFRGYEAAGADVDEQGKINEGRERTRDEEAGAEKK